jgi:hypothetical protein
MTKVPNDRFVHGTHMVVFVHVCSYPLTVGVCILVQARMLKEDQQVLVATPGIEHSFQQCAHAPAWTLPYARHLLSLRMFIDRL